MRGSIIGGFAVADYWAYLTDKFLPILTELLSVLHVQINDNLTGFDLVYQTFGSSYTPTQNTLFRKVNVVWIHFKWSCIPVEGFVFAKCSGLRCSSTTAWVWRPLCARAAAWIWSTTASASYRCSLSTRCRAFWRCTGRRVRGSWRQRCWESAAWYA